MPERAKAAFSDKRFYPRVDNKPVRVDHSLSERPVESELLNKIAVVIPRNADSELQEEIRQRLVLLVLDGSVPIECLKEAAIKCRRDIELRERQRAVFGVETIDVWRFQPDFSEELINDIDGYEQLTNIPFVRWSQDLEVMEEYINIPSKPKSYHDPLPKRGYGTQHGAKRLKNAWRFEE